MQSQFAFLVSRFNASIEAICTFLRYFGVIDLESHGAYALQRLFALFCGVEYTLFL